MGLITSSIVFATPFNLNASYFVVASTAPADIRDWALAAQAAGSNVLVCDGAADNVEIQAAIDSLNTSFPGVVHLSAGYFYLSDTININKNSTILEGEGNSSILYLNNTINKDVVNISQGWCVLRDVRVSGNKANNLVSGSGVVASTNAALCIIERVWSVDNREYGFKNTNAGQPTWLNYSNRFLWCRATENGSHGFYFYGLGGHKFVGCESGQNLGDGYYINTTETSLVNCNADSNTNGYGFNFLLGGYHTLSGFRATSNGKNGVCLQNDGHNVVSTGVVYNNGQLSYSYAEFLLASSNRNTITNLNIHTNTDALGGISAYSFHISSATSGQNNIIKGNVMKNDRTAGGASNGILLDDGNGGTIINNIFEGNQILATTPIVLLGTTNIVANKFRHNTGVITENSGTATLLNGQTSVVFAHGLVAAPTHVTISWRENPTNLIADWWWTADETNITLNGVDPGISNLDFSWEAKI